MKFTQILIAIIALMLPLNAANAFEEINTGYFSDLAVDGYDSTAYFQQAKPAEGMESFSFDWQDVTWRFVNAESLALFKANPDKYRPQYGGYCSNQMSLGNLSNIDPGVWLIYNDKLYLFGHDNGKKRWQNTGIAERIKDADAYWQKYLEENG